MFIRSWFSDKLILAPSPSHFRALTVLRMTPMILLLCRLLLAFTSIGGKKMQTKHQNVKIARHSEAVGAQN